MYVSLGSTPWELQPWRQCTGISKCYSVKEATHHSFCSKTTVEKPPPEAYPAKALDTDIVGVLAAGSSIYHSVSELIVGRVPCHPAEQLAPVLHQDYRGETWCNGLSCQDCMPACPPGALALEVLTSTVLRDPAHIWKETIDVKMLPVEVSTLFIPEVSLLLETWLCVAGLKFHSTPYTVLSTIFRPAKLNNRHTVLLCLSPHITLFSVASVFYGS